MSWEQIKTEEINPRTREIDRLSTIDMVTLMNSEDKKVALAVERELDHIAQAVDIIAAQMSGGGRLIYAGCGTSGRLGILDAAECPPTFSTDPGQVVGLIGGGEKAIFTAVEGAEDSAALGRQDLERIGLNRQDVLVGIAASGRTPYVIGALTYAGEQGVPTISVSCSPKSPVTELADVSITPTPGPEVITGSTRLKSGTAQKMVLNMLSTCSMIKLGKVYGNLMVDVKASNEKLVHRCERIVCSAAGVDEDKAKQVLKQCGYRPKVAIVMIRCGVGAEEAIELLNASGGRIVDAVAAKE